ncbi:hypothetical protein V6N13_042612 [Hibiscus sabdariffa]
MICDIQTKHHHPKKTSMAREKLPGMLQAIGNMFTPIERFNTSLTRGLARTNQKAKEKLQPLQILLTALRILRGFHREPSVSLMKTFEYACHDEEKAHGNNDIVPPSPMITAPTASV